MKNKTKFLHILICLIGIIFICLPIFHTNLWFDESYSVALARQDFSDIWEITGNDVHPPFYYFALHIIYMLGGNIVVYRLFSLAGIALLGIIRIYSYKKRFWRKMRNDFFHTRILYTSNDRICRRNKNVFLGSINCYFMCNIWI